MGVRCRQQPQDHSTGGHRPCSGPFSAPGNVNQQFLILEQESEAKLLPLRLLGPTVKISVLLGSSLCFCYRTTSQPVLRRNPNVGICRGLSSGVFQEGKSNSQVPISRGFYPSLLLAAVNILLHSRKILCHFILGKQQKLPQPGWAGLGEGDYSVSYGFHPCVRGTCRDTRWEILLHTTIVFTPPCQW